MYRWYESHYAMAGAPFVAFQNKRFTKQNFFAAARKLLSSGVDRVAVDVSSHGTVIPKNGVNHAAIVFANSTWDDLGTFGFDDDFAQLFRDFPSCRFYFTADACESADLGLRALSRGINKFIDPPADLALEIAHNNLSLGQQRAIAPVLPLLTQNLAYISGTGGKGYYSMDEGDGGAFTKAFMRCAKPAMSAREIASACDRLLDPAQQPQAHGGLVSQPWFS